MRVDSPVTMEMSSINSPAVGFKPQNQHVGRRSSGRDKRKSATYSSSEDDLHSDENLRPYEAIKMSHQEKKLNSLGK